MYGRSMGARRARAGDGRAHGGIQRVPRAGEAPDAGLGEGSGRVDDLRPVGTCRFANVHWLRKDCAPPNDFRNALAWLQLQMVVVAAVAAVGHGPSHRAATPNLPGPDYDQYCQKSLERNRNRL